MEANMSHNDRGLGASPQTILSRLTAENEQLDRRLDAALKAIGLTRAALERLPEILKLHDAARVARVEQRIAGQIHDTSDRDWERLCRPSTEQLSRSFGSRLIKV